MKFMISQKELISLLKDQELLRGLYSGGVDNWEWYGEGDMFDSANMIEEMSDIEAKEFITSLGYESYNEDGI